MLERTTSLEAETVASGLLDLMERCPEARAWIIASGCGVKGVCRAAIRVRDAMRYRRKRLGLDRIPADEVMISDQILEVLGKEGGE